jgi:hypothetical protein
MMRKASVFVMDAIPYMFCPLGTFQGSPPKSLLPSLLPSALATVEFMMV